MSRLLTQADEVVTPVTAMLTGGVLVVVVVALIWVAIAAVATAERARRHK